MKRRPQINVYNLGNIIRLSYLNKQAGTLVDSTTVTVSVIRPDNVTDGPFSMTRLSAGTYQYDYTPPSSLLGSLSNGQAFQARVTALTPNSSDRDTFVVVY